MNGGVSQDREQRAEPRAYGSLDLRYCVGSPGGAEEWLAGGPPERPLRAPDPTMSFSAAGIAFDDQPACADGDLLLVDFAVPGEPERSRAVARVVRVSPVPIDERDELVDATHRVAMTITAHGEGAEARLRAYTSRVRRANERAGEGAR